MAGRHLTRHLRPNATKTMVVYSKATGVRRRVIDADDDAEYDLHESIVHPGEGFFYLTHAEYDAHHCPRHLNHTTALKAGFAATLRKDDFGSNVGVTVHHPDGGYDLELADRHAICHPDGRVLGACCADPTCGDSGEHIGPGHLLVRHDEADETWTHKDGALIPPAKD